MDAKDVADERDALKRENMLLKKELQTQIHENEELRTQIQETKVRDNLSIAVRYLNVLA